MNETVVATLVALLKMKEELTPVVEKAKKAVKSLESTIEGVGEKAQAAFSVMAAAATAVVGAVVAATAAIVALGQRGADISDVSEQFEVLNARIGNTGDVLGRMRGAFDGTVTDFDIMKTANLALSQGLRLTEDQMALTAEASRVLADRIGGDNLQAYEKLMQAMATGQDRSLKEIGIKIDSAKAVEDYAHAMGRSTASLSDNEQVMAKRQAILRAMQQTLEVSGKAEADFGDRIAQVRVGIQNFVDTLSTAIAQSPAVNKLMEAIGDGLKEAFGENQQAAITFLMKLVNELAIVFVKIAKFGVDSANVLQQAWAGIGILFHGTIGLIDKAVGAAIGLLATMLEKATKIPLIGDKFKGAADDMRYYSDVLKVTAKSEFEQMDAAGEAGLARQKLLDGASEGLKKLAASMEKAAKEGPKAAAASKAVAGAVKEIEPAGSKSSEALDALYKKFESMTPLVGAALKNLSTRELSEQFGPALREVARDAELLGVKLPPALQEALDKVLKLAAADRELAEAQYQARLEIELATQAAEKQNALYDQWFNTINKVGDAIGGKLGGAIKGVAGFIDSTLSSYRDFQQAFFTGDVAGMIGSGVSVVSNVFKGAKSIISSLFGDGGEGKKVRQMRDDFIKAAGGIEALKRRALETKTPLDMLFNAKTVHQYEAAVAGITRHMQTWDDAQQAVNDAMERWGLTVEEMGPKFAQQKLSEQAMSLFQDWEVLAASGADMLAVAEKMGPAINEWYQQALATGASVPEAMRPVMEKWLEMGILTDANGEKLKNLDGINFTQSLEEGLQRTIDAINALVVALGGIPSSVPPVNIPINPVYGNGGGGPANGNYSGYTGPMGGPHEHAAATGFEGTVFKPTRFLVGEKGPEHVSVVPRGKGSAEGVSQAELQKEMQGMRREISGLIRTLPMMLKGAMSTSV